MKKLSILLAAFALTACNGESDDFVGGLKLNQTLIVKAKSGDVQFPAGLQESRISREGSKKLVLGSRVNNKWQEAEIKLGVSLKPDANGNFLIPAAKSKQNFDLQGNLTQDVQQTTPLTHTEGCVVGYRAGDTTCSEVWIPRSCDTITECGTNALGEKICKDRGESCSGGYSETQCHTESIPVYGPVSVTTYQIITTKHLDVKILEASSRREIGSFQGKDVNSKTKYLGGRCN